MSDTTELKPFNPQDIMQGVKDKIKSSFVELIPEENWNQMIQAEIDNFFQKNKQANTYNNNQHNKYVSQFDLMINAELKKYADEKINEHLRGPEFQAMWGNHGVTKVSEGLAKIIVENSGAILGEMIGSIFQMKISQMANQRGY